MVVREVNMMTIMMMLSVIKNGNERSYYDEDNDDAIRNKKMVVWEVNMMKIMMMLLVIEKNGSEKS